MKEIFYHDHRIWLGRRLKSGKPSQSSVEVTDATIIAVVKMFLDTPEYRGFSGLNFKNEDMSITLAAFDESKFSVVNCEAK